MKKLIRWQKIVELCEKSEKVDMASLVKELGVSEATIRRDFQSLEDQGVITRYHGGASINGGRMLEPPMLLKSEINLKQKILVGRLAAPLIQDNQIIYLDAGSSTYEMIPYITAKNVTFVTIGIPHIMRLNATGKNVMVLGGMIHSNTQAITGFQTLKQLDDLFFDIAFLGVNCIHDTFGFTTSNEQEASVKSKVIERSSVTYVLCNHSKFGKLNPVKFADFSSVIALSDDIPERFNDNLKYIIIDGRKRL